MKGKRAIRILVIALPTYFHWVLTNVIPIQ